MAFTNMGGLFVATFLTLLFLPALYALWFRRSLDIVREPSTPADQALVPVPDEPGKRPPYAVAAE